MTNYISQQQKKHAFETIKILANEEGADEFVAVLSNWNVVSILLEECGFKEVCWKNMADSKLSVIEQWWEEWEDKIKFVSENWEDIGIIYQEISNIIDSHLFDFGLCLLSQNDFFVERSKSSLKEVCKELGWEAAENYEAPNYDDRYLRPVH